VSIIFFRVPIHNVAWARAGQHGDVHFTPKRQANHMATIRQYAEAAMGDRPPLEGPLRLVACFVYVRPASWSKKRKAATSWKSSKPDASNILKLLEDSLNGCVYLDDAQIASITVEKIYGDTPLLEIAFMTLDDVPPLGISSNSRSAVERDLFS